MHSGLGKCTRRGWNGTLGHRGLLLHGDVPQRSEVAALRGLGCSSPRARHRGPAACRGCPGVAGHSLLLGGCQSTGGDLCDAACPTPWARAVFITCTAVKKNVEHPPTPIHTYLLTCMCIYTHLCIYTYICTRIYTYPCVYIYTLAYIYTHTCTCTTLLVCCVRCKAHTKIETEK